MRIGHDTLGMSLYAKRLERGKFIWPSPTDGVVVITPAQLAYMLEGISKNIALWCDDRRSSSQQGRSFNPLPLIEAA